MLLRSSLIAAALAAGAAQAAEFNFVALGDMPYGAPDKVYPAYEALIGEVNARAPALVVHVGDTKSGSTPCSDQMLDEQRGFLNSFQAPVLYTPGDNEWTDCHRKKAGSLDPLDRLDYIRRTYFSEAGKTLGAVKADIETQADKGYPENGRMTHEGVMFVTAHVVGSNNNFEIRDIKAVEEFMARDKVTTAWLEESFDKAEAADHHAVVVAIHADMFEFDYNEFGKEGWLRHSGFLNFGPALQKRAAAFGKPVLLVFGDSHIFREFSPFPKTAPNVTAVEVFGAKEMHAVEISVNTGGPRTVWGVTPIYNPAITN